MQTVLIVMLLALPWGVADYFDTLPWYLRLVTVLAWVAALISVARLGGRHGR